MTKQITGNENVNSTSNSTTLLITSKLITVMSLSQQQRFSRLISNGEEEATI